MNKLAMLALGALALTPGQAFAYDWTVTAKVTKLEGTYSPGPLPFQIDTPAGTCAAGAWLRWLPQGQDSGSQAQNYQTIMAILLTAKSTGQEVTVLGNNADCTINFMYLS